MTSMRAVRAHSRGGPGQLSCERARRPEPAPGEALVAVHAAAITPGELDWDATWTDAAGRDRTPIIPAHEMSGLVEYAPTGAAVAAGDAVYGIVPFDRDGAAAEFAAIPVGLLAPKPSGLSHLQAAALALPGLTAWQALVSAAEITSGQRVLVLGAAGGVGSMAVQLAAAFGAVVSATCSTADMEFVSSLGAIAVIDHTTSRFEDEAADLDVVVDTIGGDVMRRSATVLRTGGILVCVAEPPDSGEMQRAGIRAVYFVVEPDRDQLTRLAALAEAGQVRPVIGATYPLERAADAYASIDHDHRRGKIVLDVRCV